MAKKTLNGTFFIAAVLLIIFGLMVSVTAFAANSNTIVAAEEPTQMALNTYAETIDEQNLILAETELNDIISTITFSEYLSFDELEQYAEMYNIDLVQLQLRGLLDDGTRVTIFTRTDKGLEETETLLTDQALDDGVTIVGITGMYALIDSDELIHVMSDTRTYLVDTSGDGYSSENSITDSVQRNSVTSTNSGGFMFPKSLTWELEDLGLLG